MSLQSRFHFLNLWNETPNQSEGTDEEEKKGRVREHQSANKDTSKWPNEHSVSGKRASFCFLYMWGLNLVVLLMLWGLISCWDQMLA